MAAGSHGKSGVFIATLETLHVVAMEELGDSFIVQRIQPQLLQMGLIASVEQGILYMCRTTVCTSSTRAFNCEVAGSIF